MEYINIMYENATEEITKIIQEFDEDDIFEVMKTWMIYNDVCEFSVRRRNVRTPNGIEEKFSIVSIKER